MDYLARYMQELQERSTANKVALPPSRGTRPLAQLIRAWFDSLPPEEQRGTFSMEFFVKRFGFPAPVIGLALHDLGWTRTRIWKKNLPHRRTWMPPLYLVE